MSQEETAAAEKAGIVRALLPAAREQESLAKAAVCVRRRRHSRQQSDLMAAVEAHKVARDEVKRLDNQVVDGAAVS